MPTLYLIPVPIAESALHTLPTYVREIVSGLDFFVVERAKTARHFLKASGIHRPIQEIEVTEIDPREPDAAGNAFLEAVRSGRDVGLLSEAGCPGVADPGAAIVALAHRHGVVVKPLVGPSSLLLALMASGMDGQRFTFHGYLSPKRAELARDLRRIEQQSGTQLFIETPYRSQMVLEVALESLQPDTLFGIARDLTGADEFVLSLPVRLWRQKAQFTMPKAPAVFLIWRP